MLCYVYWEYVLSDQYAVSYHQSDFLCRMLYRLKGAINLTQIAQYWFVLGFDSSTVYINCFFKNRTNTNKYHLNTRRMLNKTCPRIMFHSRVGETHVSIQYFVIGKEENHHNYQSHLLCFTSTSNISYCFTIVYNDLLINGVCYRLTHSHIQWYLDISQ